MEFLEGLRDERRKANDKIKALQTRIAVLDELLSELGNQPQAATINAVPRMTVSDAVHHAHARLAVSVTPRSDVLVRFIDAVTRYLSEDETKSLHADEIWRRLADDGIEVPKTYLFSNLSRHFKSVRRGSGLWTLKDDPSAEEVDHEIAEEDRDAFFHAVVEDDEDAFDGPPASMSEDHKEVDF